MDFEHLRSLRFEYEDQFVVVEGDRPELLRFKGKVGRVKTINCNGRALVQFDSESDRGWYDIDLDFLHVIEPPQSDPISGAPLPPSAEKLSHPTEYKPSALELARQSKGQPQPPEKRS